MRKYVLSSSGQRHALGDVDERAVGEDRRVEGGVEVVGDRHDGADVLLHDLRTLLHRFRDRAEDDALLFELRLVSGRDRDRIEDRVDSDARKHLLLLERDAELVVGLQQLRIDLVQTLRPVVIAFRRGVVVGVLEVDSRIVDPGPGRFLHGQPVAIGLEPPLEHPFGFFLFRGDEADDVFVQALGGRLHLDLGLEAVLVAAQIFDLSDCLSVSRHGPPPSRPVRMSWTEAPYLRGLRCPARCARPC